MALYKETGTNPFASCLPLILQMPIFIALFRLVDNASNEVAKGVLTQQQANSLAHATIFGAPISASFTNNGGVASVRILAAVLVVAMTATTFLTQRQLMSKNMPADAMSGPYARQQKMLLYVLPLVFAFGGVAFPIGVLFYWTTSNLWTMGQQFYVIRNNPAPGTPAARAKAARDAERAARKGKPALGTAAPAIAEDGPEAPPAPKKQTPQRQQPKKKSRSQRKKQPPGQPKNRKPDQRGAGTEKDESADEGEQNPAGD
jgi:YidC/Oxa1 family membrane protein insertase